MAQISPHSIVSDGATAARSDNHHDSASGVTAMCERSASRPDGSAERQLLVRCPHCGGGLIFPTRRVDRGESSVLDRRCPECGRRDRVIAARRAADTWYRREERTRRSLTALAYALNDGLPIAPDDVFATRSLSEGHGQQLPPKRQAPLDPTRPMHPWSAPPPGDETSSTRPSPP
jgi:hypothetical protein